MATAAKAISGQNARATVGGSECAEKNGAP